MAELVNAERQLIMFLLMAILRTRAYRRSIYLSYQLMFSNLFHFFRTLVVIWLSERKNSIEKFHFIHLTLRIVVLNWVKWPSPLCCLYGLNGTSWSINPFRNFNDSHFLLCDYQSRQGAGKQSWVKWPHCLELS